MIPTVEPWFPPPVVVDDGACDGNEAPFDGRPGTTPAWCPQGQWPPEPRYYEVAAWPVVDQRLPADVLQELALDLADVDAAWRGLFVGEAAGIEPDDWWWTDGEHRAGLKFSEEVEVGRLEAGDDCIVWARHGELRVSDDCPVTSGGTATLRLFPTNGPGDPTGTWLVTVTARLNPVTTPTPTRPPPFVAWLGWAAAAGFALMVPAAYTMGRASAPPSPAPPPPPAPDERPADAALRAQVALLALPALRDAAKRLVSALPAHVERVAAVLSASREARNARPDLPAGYRQAWERAEADAAASLARCDTLGRTLAAALRDPDAVPSDEAIWRALFPATEVTPTDGGAALAGQLVADVLREAVVAPLALAQLVGEALPVEVPEAGWKPVATGEIAQIAGDLGWTYVHVPLYSRSDADFLLDDATVSGVRGEDVLLGVPPPAEARPGVIVRVKTPILRPPPDQPGFGRGHLLSWRTA